ncbi:uncharacterized protein LAESUDRAFT_649155 [Laetiporus sulphureus 93-53]|uniref:Aspartic peptidase DDI1-type domain-containing protein n=1 Tax=Laetiporus sulphureus 93-53 TaxID=1314785 RepID=A0A165F5F5_9APHY|nr:uncharacterized protein LAESUDRAFT_649155 [Laetiporus sulphureus 93-53]KZT08425.1 hypothetical protein LAESUDRAFT_649155 [Laetiporus sulphureus 93-53]
MKSSAISVSLEELLSISSDVRSKYCKACTLERIQPGPQIMSACYEASSDLPVDAIIAASHDSTHFAAAEPGSKSIVPDPYEVYLHHIHKHSEPDQLMVAKESHALCSVIGLVDNKENVEAIIDLGCQIIAMSENVCHALGLIYSPTVKLNMQSTNGEVNQSLSIVHNILFQIGEIILYFQIHIIRAAAYDILLGRPFDMLTESVVKNFFDEKQTITIVCPNTGQVAMIPTVLHGPLKFCGKPSEQDFH